MSSKSKKLIPFSLEEYIKNPDRKVETRDGRSVRILCTDQKGTESPILALCTMYIGNENCYSYFPNGKRQLVGDSSLDLFFVYERNEGWINIYKDDNDYHTYDTKIYSSESEAIDAIVHDEKHVVTMKLEWVE